MSNINEGPDALRAFLTGAAGAGLGQYDHDLSLGGYISSARVNCMTLHEFASFPGLRVRYAEAYNGKGVGRLLAAGQNSVKWAAPGENYGDAVDIVSGETKVIKSATASKFVVVERTSVLPLSGVANIQIIDTLNNVVGMSNFTEAQSTAGEAKYRGLILKNVGASSITNLKAWVDEDEDTRLRIAQEATVSDAIQTIADELTQPTGLSWSTPTAASPLTIGTLAAGGTVGLWIERFVAAAATANPAVTSAVRLQFDFGGTTYQASIRGVGRIAQAGIEGYLFWWGHGAEPDWENDPADEFSATLPVELAEVLDEGVHHLVQRRRNKYGIVGPPKQPFDVFDIANDLTLNVTKPSGPGLVQLRQWGGGGYRIDAHYIPEFDDFGYRASHWLIYVTTDGSDPDPDVDTPVEIAMLYRPDAPIGGLVPLKYIVETEELEDTPIKALVRTRRAENTYTGATILAADSDNLDVHSTTLEYCGPKRPDGFARYRDGLGIYTPPAEPPDEIIMIDEANNIYAEMKSGQTRLWYDDGTPHLIWNIKFDSGASPGANGIFTPLLHDAIDVSVGGATGTVETIAWNGTKQIGINVNGTRRMLIDITAGWIRNNMVSVEEEPSAACAGEPFWGKYAHTCFMVWDPSTLDYVSVASLDTQGRLLSRVGLFPALSEAECL